ncbi:hypothetical protein RQP46_003170 [Phenoliferia psychrophenolica]
MQPSPAASKKGKGRARTERRVSFDHPTSLSLNEPVDGRGSRKYDTACLTCKRLQRRCGLRVSRSGPSEGVAGGSKADVPCEYSVEEHRTAPRGAGSRGAPPPPPPSDIKPSPELAKAQRLEKLKNLEMRMRHLEVSLGAELNMNGSSTSPPSSSYDSAPRGPTSTSRRPPPGPAPRLFPIPVSTLPLRRMSTSYESFSSSSSSNYSNSLGGRRSRGSSRSSSSSLSPTLAHGEISYPTSHQQQFLQSKGFADYCPSPAPDDLHIEPMLRQSFAPAARYGVGRSGADGGQPLLAQSHRTTNVVDPWANSASGLKVTGNAWFEQAPTSSATVANPLYLPLLDTKAIFEPSPHHPSEHSPSSTNASTYRPGSWMADPYAPNDGLFGDGPQSPPLDQSSADESSYFPLFPPQDSYYLDSTIPSPFLPYNVPTSSAEGPFALPKRDTSQGTMNLQDFNISMSLFAEPSYSNTFGTGSSFTRQESASVAQDGRGGFEGDARAAGPQEQPPNFRRTSDEMEEGGSESSEERRAWESRAKRRRED